MDPFNHNQFLYNDDSNNYPIVQNYGMEPQASSLMNNIYVQSGSLNEQRGFATTDINNLLQRNIVENTVTNNAAAPRSTKGENVVHSFTFKRRESDGSTHVVRPPIVRNEPSISYRIHADYTSQNPGYSNQNQRDVGRVWDINQTGSLITAHIEDDRTSRSTSFSSTENERERFQQLNVSDIQQRVQDDETSGSENSTQEYEPRFLYYSTIDPSTVSLHPDQDEPRQIPDDQYEAQPEQNYENETNQEPHYQNEAQQEQEYQDEVHQEPYYQQEIMVHDELLPFVESSQFSENSGSTASPPQLPQHGQQPIYQEQNRNYYDELRTMLIEKKPRQDEEVKEMKKLQEQLRGQRLKNQSPLNQPIRTLQYRNHVPSRAALPYPMGSKGRSRKRSGAPKPEPDKTKFTYDQLVVICLLNSATGCASVAEMYPFIERHFFFEDNHSWKNSLRHAVNFKTTFFGKVQGLTSKCSSGAFYTLIEDMRETLVESLNEVVNKYQHNIDIFKMKNPNFDFLRALVAGQIGFETYRPVQKRNIRRNQQVPYAPPVPLRASTPLTNLQKNAHNQMPGPSNMVNRVAQSWIQISPIEHQANVSPIPEMNGALTPALSSIVPTEAFQPGPYYQENKPANMNQSYKISTDIRGQKAEQRPVPYARRESLMQAGPSNMMVHQPSVMNQFIPQAYPSLPYNVSCFDTSIAPGSSNMVHQLPMMNQLSSQANPNVPYNVSCFDTFTAPGPSYMQPQMETWNNQAVQGYANVVASHLTMQTKPVRKPKLGENLLEEFFDFSKKYQENGHNMVNAEQPGPSNANQEHQEDLLAEFFMQSSSDEETVAEHHQEQMVEEYMEQYPMDVYDDGSAFEAECQGYDLIDE